MIGHLQTPVLFEYYYYKSLNVDPNRRIMKIESLHYQDPEEFKLKTKRRDRQCAEANHN